MKMVPQVVKTFASGWATCLMIWFLAFGVFPYVAIIWFVRKVLYLGRQPLPPGGRHVAFFHPWCSSGGGSERVLWSTISALEARYPNHRYYIFTGEREAMSAMLSRAHCQFGITLPNDVEAVGLRLCWLLSVRNYPVFPLLCRSLAAALVSAEAIVKLLPDVYIDTQGLPFCLPVFRLLGGSWVATYMHAPTIVAEDLQLKQFDMATIGFSPLQYAWWQLRALYLRAFAVLERLAASAAHVVMVSGDWTERHVARAWRPCDSLHVLYPPCDTDRLCEIPLEAPRGRNIVSVGHFWPEKNHRLQLESFSRLVSDHPRDAEGARLLLVGGCHSTADMKRVEELRQLGETLGIHDRLEFRVNATFEQVLELLERGSVGLHTCEDEAFGIGVVEMMAAGIIVIGHRSGGTRDIITEPDATDADVGGKARSTGFLAAGVEEYAARLHEVIAMSDQQRMQIRVRARASTQRFSRGRFDSTLAALCANLMGPLKPKSNGSTAGSDAASAVKTATAPAVKPAAAPATAPATAPAPAPAAGRQKHAGDATTNSTH